MLYVDRFEHKTTITTTDIEIFHHHLRCDISRQVKISGKFGSVQLHVVSFIDMADKIGCKKAQQSNPGNCTNTTTKTKPRRKLVSLRIGTKVWSPYLSNNLDVACMPGIQHHFPFNIHKYRSINLINRIRKMNGSTR